MTTSRPAVLVALLLGLFAPERASADPPLTEDLEEVGERIRLAPGEISLLIERSDVFLREARPHDALADLHVAAAIAPGDPRIASQRAVVLHALSREEEALAEISSSASAWRSTPTRTRASRPAPTAR